MNPHRESFVDAQVGISGLTEPREQILVDAVNPKSGSVLNYYGQMCRAMNSYPHKPCRVGAALSTLPSSCAPVATTSNGPWPHRHRGSGVVDGCV